MHRERQWPQANLGAKLRTLQARPSVVERGDGSLTADHLIELLRLFNLHLEDIADAAPIEAELQTALARLEAPHLRTVPIALPSARVASARAAVRETLMDPRDTRLLLTLAPVLVAHVDAFNLDLLHDELRAAGSPARVPWLVENVHAAFSLAAPPKRRGPLN